MKQEDWEARMRGEPLPAFTTAAVPEAPDPLKKPVEAIDTSQKPVDGHSKVS